MTAWGAASLVQMVSNIQPYENANPGSPLQIGRNLSISLQARTSTAFPTTALVFPGWLLPSCPLFAAIPRSWRSRSRRTRVAAECEGLVDTDAISLRSPFTFSRPPERSRDLSQMPRHQ